MRHVSCAVFLLINALKNNRHMPNSAAHAHMLSHETHILAHLERLSHLDLLYQSPHEVLPALNL